MHPLGRRGSAGVLLKHRDTAAREGVSFDLAGFEGFR